VLVCNVPRRLAVFVSLLVSFLTTTLNAQNKSSNSSVSPSLSFLEKHIASEFNLLRTSAGLKPLHFRNDKRVRMEACSVAENGPDLWVEREPSGRQDKNMHRYWYTTTDPMAVTPELLQIASFPVSNDSVAVGVYLLQSTEQSKRAYWVVVYPEHSALHEAFWGHFYLTDSFEYETAWSGEWKQHLPKQCRKPKH
jgi:hypothetical protein